VEVLSSQIEAIKKQANLAHTFHIDVHKSSGSFTLAFLSEFTSAYDNMNNIIVKLGPQNGAADSLLVNCHYDTVVDSPGAGDDFVSCAVMLEVLQVLSQSNVPLKHNVIFLFNGAEENILQASHGFITQHAWARDIRAFVNLDSAGAGGRELLFQAGPDNPWMLYTYAESVPYPFASVVGQEIFQSGIIPSDTDYRIFRDYGNISGMDIAYISNGYVYHTPFDTPERIQRGSIQRAGENMLALVKSLANSPYLADPGEFRHGSAVFLDILGFGMIMYPARLGYLLNFLTAVVVLTKIILKIRRVHVTGTASRTYTRMLLKAMCVHVLSWLVGMLQVTAVALLVTYLCPMSWFTNRIVIFGLFAIPAATSMLFLQLISRQFIYKGFSDISIEVIVYEAQHVLMACFLLILTVAKINSAVWILMWVLGPLITRDLIGKIANVNFQSNPVVASFLHLVGVSLASMLTLYSFYGVFEMFIPIMGRVGTETLPDVFIAVLVGMLTVLLLGFHVSLIHISQHRAMLLKVLVAVFTITLLAVATTSLGFPFRANPEEPTRQRQIIHHLQRTMYDQHGKITQHDSGLWLIPFDVHQLDLVKNNGAGFLSDAAAVICDDTLPYCGWPYYFPLLTMMSKTWYLPAPPLEGLQHAHVKLVSRAMHIEDSTKERLTFNLTGPSHVNVYVTAAANVDILDWSVGDHLPQPSLMPPGIHQKCYFLYYAYGTQPANPFQFWVDVELPAGHIASSPVLNLALGAHYINEDTQHTAPLKDYLSKMPDWTVPIGWTAEYQAFVF